jgi:hypothetical protein
MGPKVRIDPCRSLGNPWPIGGRRASPPPAARRFRPWISEIRQPGVRPFRGHRVPASRRGRPCPREGRRRPFRCRSFLRRSSRVRRLHLPRCLRCTRRCPRPPSRNAIRRTPRSNRPLPGRASATGIVSLPLNRRPRGNPGGRPGWRRGSPPGVRFPVRRAPDIDGPGGRSGAGRRVPVPGRWRVPGAGDRALRTEDLSSCPAHGSPRGSRMGEPCDGQDRARPVPNDPEPARGGSWRGPGPPRRASLRGFPAGGAIRSVGGAVPPPASRGAFDQRSTRSGRGERRGRVVPGDPRALR